MNLNDVQIFSQIDTQNMLSHIDGLPDQILGAWELGKTLPLPKWVGIKKVLIAGMGGSAIGGDLLAAYLAPLSSVPIWVHRDYGLPNWAQGEDTLVIVSSHSGNTEEVLDALGYALNNRCRVLAITTGGELARRANAASLPLWQFKHIGQPRAAVGYSFFLLLAALYRLGLAPDPQIELDDTIAAMKAQQSNLVAEIPDIRNPAKRYGGQLVGRWVTVLGAGILAPVARRWKGQVNELAKAWGHFDYLPEADHNLLAGSSNPPENIGHLAVFFLRAPSDHPRNRLRSDLTRKSLMLNGFATDFYDAKGESRLAQQWTALHFGDYTAYYLAMAYEVDPSPVDAIENFKIELNSES